MRVTARHFSRTVGCVLAAILTVLVGGGPALAHEGHGNETFSALVFSKTAGFRHDSIPAGVAAIEALGAEHGFEVTATEDASVFNDEDLAEHEVVIWLSTTGDVLNADQQAAFERYIQAGGGYAGVHAASDTEYDWPWYGRLVGAYFADHPEQQDAAVRVEDPAHPSTAPLPVTWERHDEWYNYRDNPRGDVHVLASLDETSYNGGSMGAEHPISWCHNYDGGRSWYTGMGHGAASFEDPLFLDHLLGGIRTAAGVLPADCGASLTGNYEKVTLDDNTSNPMELAIAEDGRVFYIDRNGDVRVVRTDGSVVTAGTLEVYTGQEFGLLGLALDPDFAANGWIYLYYSPAGSDPVDRVSRFTLRGDSLDPASEEVLLEVDVQRQECCHAGGALEFDTQGNLYITTGDNTNPFASDGYSPLDERDGRRAWDAQSTSANSAVLNGKVLRITPQPDGGYTVPEGNLFPPGTEDTRPEIFAMGFRNPFRIGIDPFTDRLFVADYGPDAGSADPARGPDGRVEWNIVDEPGFYGWPYCVGDNTPYVDYDFATSTPGAPFNCSAPVNDSPNNTGLRELPAAIPAELWMGSSGVSNSPEIGGSGAPLTSGAYRFDAELDSARKWPAYFDGKAVWADWNNSRMFSIQPDEERTGVADVSRILEEMSFIRPHALQFGPDGALYVIEWGSGFGGNNADSGVYRIDYIQGNRAPVARLGADRTSGPLPLEVYFDSVGSHDPDGQPVTFSWDFDGDGTEDSTEASATHTYTEAGRYTARLTVTDSDGRSSVSNQDITAGNTAPEIEVSAPANGGFFEFGDTISYEVAVTDPEDGEVDCADVVVQPGLGHDEHSHGYEQYHGCSGTFPLPGDEGHTGANIFGTVTVTYTDRGNGQAPPLTTQEVLVLQPKHREAEHFDTTGRLSSAPAGGAPGVQPEPTGDTAGGGQNIGFIEDGDWWAWDPANLTGIEEIGLRAASPSAGATVEVRAGDPETGPLVATVEVEPTGDWQGYQDFTAPVDGASGTGSGPLYFVKTTGQLNVNWVDFTGRGVTENQRPEVTLSADPVSGEAPLEVDFTAEATDPEGDAVEYAWAFGDGGTATGATTGHTYTAAGDYRAQVTATDARGARATRAVDIRVTGPSAENPCLTGRSDGFDGTALDTGRWSEVVRANQDLAVRDGHLALPLTATDIFGTGNGGTPNIVLQPLPDGAWQATTKVTLPARLAYQQAGLIVYGDDDNYAKMVLQGRSGGEPSADQRIFQFIREENGAPNEVGESNTAALGADFPDTYWVRFTSDGEDLRASYSADGTTFTDMPQVKSLAGIDNPRIGLFGLANRAEALPVTAEFDHFSLTPDDTATAPEPSDEFDGTALDPCRWTGVVRPDPAARGVGDGALRIDTSEGDIYQGTASDPTNLILQPAPEGDWTIQTAVDASAFDERYQQAGLMVYGDDTTYLKLDYLTTNAPGSPVTRGIELRNEIDDTVVAPSPNAEPAPTQGVWHLRLAKSGDTYTGSFSADGEDWTSLEPVTNAALGSGTPRFGVFALGAGQTASKPAYFEYFRVLDADTTAPQVELSTDPAEPTGTDGWFTGPVTLTATAEDDAGGEVSPEYQVGDGAWAPYTEPVRLTGDGEHTVRVRAADAAGNVSEPVSTVIRIDATAPAVTVGGVAAGDRLGLAAPVDAEVAGEDAGSGVAAVAVTLDGEPAPSPLRLDPVTLGLGEHELVATVTDAAGNVTETALPFTVAADYAGAVGLVQRLVAEAVVGDREGDRLIRHLRAAERHADGGRERQAERELERFADRAGGLPEGAVRTLLGAAARELREQL